MMQVYKFGGASIATPERMRQLLPIIQQTKEPLVIVVSALGKTTNALEDIVSHACLGEKEEALKLATDLIDNHINFASVLLVDVYKSQAKEKIISFSDELKAAIGKASGSKYDFSYDQIVCIGELLSTAIFNAFLLQEGFPFQWVDVRSIISTDDTFRDARVLWKVSEKKAKEILQPFLLSGKNIITQGFIGRSDSGASVTLGREGSDYTAAMLAAMLGASAVTIWKDVEGLLNADPKLFSNTVKIEAITYHEVIEMSYYGAQVIHPKTIKPLQNSKIPLYVKCFLKPELKGTIIQNEVDSMFYPPLIVLKKNQILLQVTTRDFSFVTEDNLRHLYGIFHELKIKVNLIQNAAISFVACIDHAEDKVHALINRLSEDYRVFRNENAELLTIRHYTPEVLQDLTRRRFILLEQKTRHTVQVLMSGQS
ncbi:MAG: aspartate kinase [Bacteroidetes bacterium]|nr:aspartate kinase [Bacteroidota bacterium]MBS1740552.1 aspartate kinase [Bacteroidota bacterium]MBS1776199.1 aspartate kinase [Bacteroidota bacterium]